MKKINFMHQPRADSFCSFLLGLFFVSDEKKLRALRNRAQGIKEAQNIELGKLECALSLKIQDLKVESSIERVAVRQYWIGELNKTLADIAVVEKRIQG